MESRPTFPTRGKLMLLATGKGRVGTPSEPADLGGPSKSSEACAPALTCLLQGLGEGGDSARKDLSLTTWQMAGYLKNTGDILHSKLL